MIRVVNDIGGRDMSLSKNVERHHFLRHVEMSSDIFKNVDAENVEIFKRAKFKHLSTKNSFVAQGVSTCYKLLILNIMLIVKRHIFYDTCVMYLIIDEIEWKKKWKKYFENRNEKNKHAKNNLISPYTTKAGF